MKLNKLALALALALVTAGSLPCLSAHAEPVEATATLNVTATTEITHQLTAVSGVYEGAVAADKVLAKGMITALNSPLKKVSLAWVRGINPKADGKGADFAKITKEGGADSDMVVVQLKPETTVSQTQSQSDADKTTYTLSDAMATTFQYNVVSADANNVLKGGSYKMTVQADVVQA
ncbi:hypothetical protein AV553_24215 [Salmonella enterica]|nr:hypothetical protein [Salmonella enterica]